MVNTTLRGNELRVKITELLPAQLGSERNKHMSERPFIVLLSHMRSYSSVLSHILGSHPRICGHSELHCQTLTHHGILAAERVLVLRDNYANAKFLFDKAAA